MANTDIRIGLKPNIGGIGLLVHLLTQCETRLTDQTQHTRTVKDTDRQLLAPVARHSDAIVRALVASEATNKLISFAACSALYWFMLVVLTVGL